MDILRNNMNKCLFEFFFNATHHQHVLVYILLWSVFMDSGLGWDQCLHIAHASLYVAAFRDGDKRPAVCWNAWTELMICCSPTHLLAGGLPRLGLVGLKRLSVLAASEAPWRHWSGTQAKRNISARAWKWVEGGKKRKEREKPPRDDAVLDLLCKQLRWRGVAISVMQQQTTSQVNTGTLSEIVSLEYYSIIVYSMNVLQIPVYVNINSRAHRFVSAPQHLGFLFSSTLCTV